MTMMFTVVLALLLSACGNQQDTPEASPPIDLKPVTLRIHAWTGYAEPIRADFVAHMRTQGYDVALELQPATGLESFREALESGSADLISPANDIILNFIHQDLVQPLDHHCSPTSSRLTPHHRTTRAR